MRKSVKNGLGVAYLQVLASVLEFVTRNLRPVVNIPSKTFDLKS